MQHFIEIETENKGKVTIHYKWLPKVGGYTVYNSNVYRVVASQGNILDLTYTLESEVTGERFSVKQPESAELRELIKPTGYLKV